MPPAEIVSDCIGWVRVRVGVRVRVSVTIKGFNCAPMRSTGWVRVRASAGVRFGVRIETQEWVGRWMGG